MTSAAGANLVEFDRQLDALIDHGYPAMAGLSVRRFRGTAAGVREAAAALSAAAGRGDAIPMVLVVGGGLVGLREQALAMRTAAGAGITDMPADDLARFRPIEGVDEPDAPFWLVHDVDTGAAFLNVTPDDALVSITRGRRSPLTVAEGIAVVTQRPGILRERNCFSLLGSRCGDRRVTAVWVSRRRPKLGWCWAGNPHTWLGSASCGGRSWKAPDAARRLAG